MAPSDTIVPFHGLEAGIVDAHNHLGRWLSVGRERWLSPERGWVPTDLAGGRQDIPWTVADVDALLAMLDEHRVETVVNLDGRWGAELEDNLERYDRAAPGRFVTFCQLDWSQARSGDGFGDTLARSLECSIRSGARGLKVWKTLGLGWRDAAGRLLLPDDPRIAPVWRQAGALGVPVLIHTAALPAFFKPPPQPGAHSHPDRSFYGEGFPSFERLQEAFEALVAAHPETMFIGAHLALAQDLSWLDRLLRSYPNLSVDVSARQSLLSQAPDARGFILRHADRVLFGSDRFPPSGDAYTRWFTLLEQTLTLPAGALRAIYRENALRLLAPCRDTN